MQVLLDRQIYVGLLATSQGEVARGRTKVDKQGEVARGRTKVDKQGEYASTYSPRLELEDKDHNLYLPMLRSR